MTYVLKPSCPAPPPKKERSSCGAVGVGGPADLPPPDGAGGGDPALLKRLFAMVAIWATPVAAAIAAPGKPAGIPRPPEAGLIAPIIAPAVLIIAVEIPIALFLWKAFFCCFSESPENASFKAANAPSA